jgi:Inositol hexakisphosphate
MKKVALSFILLFMSMSIFANDGTLVFDSKRKDSYPSLYRSTFFHDSQFIPKMIASGQFNDNQLAKIIKAHPGFHITVIDLREESHGIINGKTPFSWYAIKNWGNQGKSQKTILHDEKKGYKKLEKQRVALIAEIKKKSNDGEIIDKTEHAIRIQRVISEKVYVTAKGLGHKRLLVTDRQPPSDITVDKWVELLKKMDVEKSIYYLHCRVGSGRTTQFMVMADIWFNSKSDSLETIIERQHLMGGRDLTKLPDKDHYSYPHAVARLQLMKDFYKFVKQYPGGEHVFSTWRNS